MSIKSMNGDACERPNKLPGLLVSAFSLCLMGGTAFAESDHDHDDDHGSEMRHAESHEHGAAELAIALDGQKLVAEFKSPAMNIVGFEHEAKDADQTAAVEAAIEKLRLGDDLMQFEGAACTLLDADVEAEGLLAEAHEEDHHDDHEEDHHDDEHHDDEHHDEGEHHGEETHSEFEVKYTFNCTTPDQLSGVSVSFIEQWSGIEEIEAVFLSEDHQLSVELTAEKAEFEVQ